MPRFVRARALWAAVAVVAFILMGWSWAYASPPGSANGDSEGMIAVWCAGGEGPGCLPTGVPNEVFVPEWVARPGCFAADRDASARCTLLLTAEPTAVQLPPPAQEPALFHRAMHAFVGPDIARSAVIMRFANVVLAAALIALAALVSRPVPRRALLLSWATVVAPVGIFFIASTSSVSWVLIGAGTFWAFAIALLQRPERPWRWAAAAIGALVSGTIAVTSSSDAAFLLALSIVVALLIAWPRLMIADGRSGPSHAGPRIAAVIVALVAAGALTVLGWISRVGTGEAAIPLVFPPGDQGRDQPNAVLKAVLELPSFIAAMIGSQPPAWAQRMSPLDVGIPGYTWPGFTYGLGHTEHLLPSLVGVFLIAAVGAVTLSGFVSYTWRKVIAFTLVLAAFTAVVLFRRSLVAFAFLVDPLLPQQFWPFLLLGVGVALVVFPARRRLWSGTQIGLLVFLLAVAQSVALRGTIARYTHGQAHSYTQLTDEPRWWWPSGPEPDQLWLLGTVAGIVAYTIVMCTWNRSSAVVRPAERRDSATPQGVVA